MKTSNISRGNSPVGSFNSPKHSQKSITFNSPDMNTSQHSIGSTTVKKTTEYVKYPGLSQQEVGPSKIEIEKVIEKPVYYEKEVEKYIEVPVDRVVYVDTYKGQLEQVSRDNKAMGNDLNEKELIIKEQLQEIYELRKELDMERQQEPVIIEKVKEIEIEKPIYIDKIVEKIIEIPKEKIVEIIKERVKEVPIEKPVEVLVEKIVQVPVEKIISKPVIITQTQEQVKKITSLENQVKELQYVLEDKKILMDNLTAENNHLQKDQQIQRQSLQRILDDFRQEKTQLCKEIERIKSERDQMEEKIVMLSTQLEVVTTQKEQLGHELYQEKQKRSRKPAQQPHYLTEKHCAACSVSPTYHEDDRDHPCRNSTYSKDQKEMGSRGRLNSHHSSASPKKANNNMLNSQKMSQKLVESQRGTTLSSSLKKPMSKTANNSPQKSPPQRTQKSGFSNQNRNNNSSKDQSPNTKARAQLINQKSYQERYKEAQKYSTSRFTSNNNNSHSQNMQNSGKNPAMKKVNNVLDRELKKTESLTTPTNKNNIREERKHQAKVRSITPQFSNEDGYQAPPIKHVNLNPFEKGYQSKMTESIPIGHSVNMYSSGSGGRQQQGPPPSYYDSLKKNYQNVNQQPDQFTHSQVSYGSGGNVYNSTNQNQYSHSYIQPSQFKQYSSSHQNSPLRSKATSAFTNTIVSELKKNEEAIEHRHQTVNKFVSNIGKDVRKIKSQMGQVKNTSRSGSPNNDDYSYGRSMGESEPYE